MNAIDPSASISANGGAFDLEARDIWKTFGGMQALAGVSIHAEPGRVLALVGPNGAGKTTLFNVLSGFLRPDSGIVTMAGNDVTAQPPQRLAARGLGRLFQDVRVFRKLSALDNVLVARRGQRREGALRAIILQETPSTRASVGLAAMEYLRFVGLADKASAVAENLSYGEQKLVAIARLLALDAQVFLLDEPVAGVHPSMIQRILSTIRRLADQGRTVMVIEHNMEVVRQLADVVALLDRGRIVSVGDPAAVLSWEVLRDVFVAKS